MAQHQMHCQFCDLSGIYCAAYEDPQKSEWVQVGGLAMEEHKECTLGHKYHERWAFSPDQLRSLERILPCKAGCPRYDIGGSLKLGRAMVRSFATAR